MKSESTTNNHFDLTQSAIRHFSSLLSNKDNQNIRIGIRDSGCSGYAYFLEFSESINNDDLEFNFEDFKVLIDEKSFTFLMNWMCNNITITSQTRRKLNQEE